MGCGRASTGRMHIAIECPRPVSNGLFPVLEQFRKKLARCGCRLFRPGLAFDALPALLREERRIWLVSSDPEIAGCGEVC